MYRKASQNKKIQDLWVFISESPINTHKSWFSGRVKYRRNNGFVNKGDGDTLGIAIVVIPTALCPN